jgi:formamidopyrimidine-DNA glycosylase
MPELPEVEIARRNLERWLAGRRVVRGEASESRVFRDAPGGPGAGVAAFRRLSGRLERLERRGKVLLLSFERGQGLLAHLGMTGKLLRRPLGAAVPHSRGALVLDSREAVHLSDPRLFGRLVPLPAAELAPRVASLGRDPLVDGLTGPQLREALAGSRRELKVALMEQERVAGLGNIHAAEALFRAGLHPARAVESLGPAEWERLAAGVHAALAFGLEEQEAEDVTYLEDAGAENRFLVYGRGGGPCTACGRTVEAFPQGGRTTHACPRCQPRSQPRSQRSSQPRSGVRRKPRSPPRRGPLSG